MATSSTNISRTIFTTVACRSGRCANMRSVGFQDLSDFRTAYTQTLLDIDMQAARSAHGFIDLR